MKKKLKILLQKAQDFNEVVFFDLSFHKYKPLSGHSYSPLPDFLRLKNAIINVKIFDTECFKWAITSAIYPNNSNYHYLGQQMRENSKKFNWDGIDFPVSLDKISQFEKIILILLQFLDIQKRIRFFLSWLIHFQIQKMEKHILIYY